MPYKLKNKNLEIHIDLPGEGYSFSRFDWTGKITQVKFHSIPLSISERLDRVNDTVFGKGFYNEFGIDSALGYNDIEIGGWFHKIGIGLLQKEEEGYFFHKKHTIKPAAFEVISTRNTIKISCISENVNGYAYVLKKNIILNESGFKIKYHLENRGEKDIHTNEYVHNFMAINNEPIGSDYKLKFPFQLKPALFDEMVNKERQVSLGSNDFSFKGTPNEQFFFKFLSGSEEVDASWELLNHKHKIGVSEKGSFKTNKVNLWGWKHVVSPELFIDIFIKPGQSKEWSRVFEVYKLNEVHGLQ
ncbi:hypothetical protein [Maribacter sp. HTCC2170]|uniref:hypothetical protein n=1 Tax=Maribacter sp. (strain HTCC2170 / KCCM 42371) TaxID=313603 RepID=UPI00006BD4A9|nr:hypothetical protein [Maribacter sp. HTCC2170]EAR02428.1 hypothetical protein FB2170_04055 [Maribacter sp. HTCC2170]